jgi:ribose transport system permease protein
VTAHLPPDEHREVRLTGRTFGWVNLLRGQGLFLILLGVILTFSLASPYFFTVANIVSIATASAALGIMAIPQTYLIISGGMDVSVGSVVALTGVIIGLVVSAGVSVWAGAVIAILAAAAVGACNGVLVVVLQVNPLIATLGSLSIFTGLAYVISGNKTLIVSDHAFAEVGSARLGTVPVAVLIVILLFLLALFAERKTPIGRSIFAIGGNRAAARLVGIPIRLIPLSLYVLSGACAGLAGVLTTSELGAGSPQVGDTFLLSVITAVILGGASLQGGAGSVLGTLVAVFILGTLQSGFTLLQYSSSTQQMAQGVALIIAVLLDQFTRSQRFRRSRPSPTPSE